MRSSLSVATLWVATATLLTSPALGGVTVSIKDVKLGKHLYGPEWKPEDLEGRVVLYEFWGLK